MSNPKLNFKEDSSAKKTRSPPEKSQGRAVYAQKEKAENGCRKSCRKETTSTFWQGRADPG